MSDESIELNRAPALRYALFRSEGGTAGIREPVGLSLFYQQAGSGEPSFLFVHGWCCDHTFFQPQFDRLKASHLVTTLDLRGCGTSDQPSTDYQIATLADDVAWLCGELAISKPIVVGHSLGAFVAIELAARHPSTPFAIVGVEPGPITPFLEDRRRFEGLVAQLEGAEGENARQSFIESLFLPTDDVTRKRSIAEAMGSVPMEVAVAMMHGALAWNGITALSACPVPALILLAQPGGSNDPSRLLAIKPDLHVGITVGSGHFPQLEVPEQVTPMIERFARMTAQALSERL